MTDEAPPSSSRLASFDQDSSSLLLTIYVHLLSVRKCARAETLVMRIKAQVGGGTTRTAMRTIETLTVEKMRELRDPYSLDPPESRW